MFRATQKSGVTLTKVYGAPAEPDWRGAISGIVRDAGVLLAAAPYSFSVNYGEARKFDAATADQAIGAYPDLEYLDLLSRKTAAGLFVTTPFARVLAARMYECCFYRTGDTEQEAFFFDVVRLACRHLRVVYGYGRELPPDSNALSETVTKRTLFGNSVLTSDPKVHVWKTGPTANGGIKGLYRFNLLHSAMLRDDIPLRSFVETLPSDRIKAVEQDLSAMVLEQADLERARSSKELKGFVRF
jgi:hypothetical protein